MNTSKSDQPRLNVRGTQVALGPLRPEHIDLYVDYMQDVELTLLSNGEFRLPAREREASFLENAMKEGLGFVIYALPDLQLIGMAGLMQLHPIHRTATLWIKIGEREYWGKGCGTEATRLVVDYGFRFLNLYNVMLYTSEFNRRAQRAYEKAGFKLIGRRRGGDWLNGKRYDVVLMDCLADEFESPHPGWFEFPETQ